MPVEDDHTRGAYQRITNNLYDAERIAIDGERKKRLHFESELQRVQTEHARLIAELDIERSRRLEAEKRAAALEKAGAERTVRPTMQNLDGTGSASGVRRILSGSKDTLGTMLLSYTHPTGKYIRTEPPLITESTNSKALNAIVCVTWKGAFLEREYKTFYALAFNSEGFSALSIHDDDSIIAIDPQNLRNATAELRSLFNVSK